jgi:hypothetical protein
MPEEFVQKAGALVASGRDREALGFVSKYLCEPERSLGTGEWPV